MQDRPFAITEIGELLQPVEIPIVVLRQVVLGEAVPRRSSTAAHPRLFQKWRLNLVAGSPRRVMFVAPPVRSLAGCMSRPNRPRQKVLRVRNCSGCGYLPLNGPHLLNHCE